MVRLTADAPAAACALAGGPALPLHVPSSLPLAAKAEALPGFRPLPAWPGLLSDGSTAGEMTTILVGGDQLIKGSLSPERLGTAGVRLFSRWLEGAGRSSALGMVALSVVIPLGGEPSTVWVLISGWCVLCQLPCPVAVCWGAPWPALPGGQ